MTTSGGAVSGKSGEVVLTGQMLGLTRIVQVGVSVKLASLCVEVSAAGNSCINLVSEPNDELKAVVERGLGLILSYLRR